MPVKDHLENKDTLTCMVHYSLKSLTEEENRNKAVARER